MHILCLSRTGKANKGIERDAPDVASLDKGGLASQIRNENFDEGSTITIPCEFMGDRAETLSTELEAGDTVVICGRLAYRSTAEQSGGSLGVWCQLVQKLNARSAMSATS
jgi:hypothetical protein